MKNKIPKPKNEIQYLYEDIKEIAEQFPTDYKWNYEELCNHFPEDLLVKVEIIENSLFVYPSPTLEHQSILENVLVKFHRFIKDDNLGQLLLAPLDVQLDQNNISQPDILFVAKDNRKILGEASIEGAPDLIIEIWLPMESSKIREAKRELYQKNKVTEFWQVYPKRKQVFVEVLNEKGNYQTFSEAEKEGIIKSKVLTGFEINITDIFED
ncbi:Uma2 family endonuclease [Bernardetia sp. MNP-M8]|uniref:Uma2 family endonuclease n=1 Tax=Bernardetia sp. MNP-M8 TaxID=3127470 RepID=UPI0030CCA581